MVRIQHNEMCIECPVQIGPERNTVICTVIAILPAFARQMGCFQKRVNTAMGNHTLEIIFSKNSFPESTLLQPYFDFRHTETWPTLSGIITRPYIIGIGNSTVLLQDCPQRTLRVAGILPVHNFITLNICQNELITSVGRLTCFESLIVPSINQFLFFNKVNTKCTACRDLNGCATPVAIQIAVILLIVVKTVFSFRINVFGDNCWPKNCLE